MCKIFEIVQGITSKIMKTVGVGTATSTTIPQAIIDAVDDCGFLESIPVWAVILLGWNIHYDIIIRTDLNSIWTIL